MIKVVHLIDDVGLGGVTRVLADHLPRLTDSWEHRVEVIAPGWRLPNRMDADVVLVHFTLNWSKLPFLLALRARLGRRQLVLVEHSYTENYERIRVRNRTRFRTMLRIGYQQADRVVAVSRGQADWLNRADLVPSGCLVTIPQSCDTSGLAALPPVRTPEGPLRLGAYGRYAPQKGFDVLIDAMRQITPDVATLHLAGYGHDMDALQRAAAELPHVCIAGPIDGPSTLLVCVDAVVIPSRWEAFGLVAAEARAAGRAVIASRVDGLIEQIEPPWGILVKPEDPNDLAAAITILAARDVVTMGAEAKHSGIHEFDRTIELWSRLLLSLHGTTGTVPAITEKVPADASFVSAGGN
jgi:D-inositol-3-phosphate glycosyltransferase